MDHYAGIDVSLELSSVCVVDASGKIAREDKVASDPEALLAWFGCAKGIDGDVSDEPRRLATKATKKGSMLRPLR